MIRRMLIQKNMMSMSSVHAYLGMKYSEIVELASIIKAVPT
jgi:hypothetical protein